MDYSGTSECWKQRVELENNRLNMSDAKCRLYVPDEHALIAGTPASPRFSCNPGHKEAHRRRPASAREHRSNHTSSSQASYTPRHGHMSSNHPPRSEHGSATSRSGSVRPVRSGGDSNYGGRSDSGSMKSVSTGSGRSFRSSASASVYSGTSSRYTKYRPPSRPLTSDEYGYRRAWM